MKLVIEAICKPSSAFDLAWIVAVRIRLRDPTILVVDLELGPCIAADLAAAIYRIPLGVEVPAGTLSATATYIPATAVARHHMMGARFLTLSHFQSPYDSRMSADLLISV
jgi:hypothetical protein